MPGIRLVSTGRTPEQAELPGLQKTERYFGIRIV